VEPGEIVILEEGKERSPFASPRRHEQLCVFELIYFGRPTRTCSAEPLRVTPGWSGAARAPVAADLSCPCRTRAPLPRGFAEGSGLPYREGWSQPLLRSDVHPAVKACGQRGVTVKLSPLREVVAGKSSSSWTTRSCAHHHRQIVALLRKAGATRFTSASAHRDPPSVLLRNRHQIETELIASTHSVDEIRDFVARFLSYSRSGRAGGAELPYDRFCFACFDGRYPVPVPYDTARHKFCWRDAVGEPSQVSRRRRPAPNG